MSSFICEFCGKLLIDTNKGYITGCEHFPADIFPCYNKKCEYFNEQVYENCTKNKPFITQKCPNFLSFEEYYKISQVNPSK